MYKYLAELRGIFYRKFNILMLHIPKISPMLQLAYDTYTD